MSQIWDGYQTGPLAYLSPFSVYLVCLVYKVELNLMIRILIPGQGVMWWVELRGYDSLPYILRLATWFDKRPKDQLSKCNVHKQVSMQQGNIKMVISK